MILKEQNEDQVYSDGAITETKMLEIAKKYPEDLAQDYIAQCSEYTVNNTFSMVRHNILNWYPFKENADILEVGAGMGSLTGMLCDRAGTVTAVEMSAARADVIRARYPKRDNLEVISEDITKWKTEKKFDYVVFVGVLEYAAVFSDTPNPFEDFLKSARDLLKEHGTVLFAIENRFGLKYWVGGSEDHLQTPYVGLEGYENKKTPRTFSKYELSEMLQNVGLKNHRFYYVFPDYKFPELICTDEYKPSYMNLQKVSFTYSKNSVLATDEKKLYKDLVENDVWRFFANSYLVEASADSLCEPHVIHVSARGEAQKKYKVNTVVYNDGNVYKRPACEDAVAHINSIYENTCYLQSRGLRVLDLSKERDGLVCKWHEGQSAQQYFCDLLRANKRKELFEFIEHFRNEILKSSDLTFDGDICCELNTDLSEYATGPILEKGFVDLTFYNAFFEDQEFIFYDQEWCFENIPLNFILFYAIRSAYERAGIKTDISLKEIWDYLGIGKAIFVFQRLEEYIWSKVLYRQTDFYGADGYCNRYSEAGSLKKLLTEKEALQRDGEVLRQEKDELGKIIQKDEQDISNLKRDISNREQDISKLKQEASNREQDVLNLEQEVRNKVGHIELLLPAERELIAIKNSIMFRIMRLGCRVLDVILFIPKIVVKKLIAAWKIIKRVNIPKLKIAFGYCREEGLREAWQHLMRDYHQGELKQIRINLNEKIYEKITSLEECRKIKLPIAEEPLVSIVIPAYNQFTYTYYCIDSIAKNSGDVAYEVILADDCSDDLTVHIQEVVDNLIVARTKKNLLFLRNCNQAAKRAKGKYILFLNNDTQVQENWLKPLTDLLDNNPEIGMTGSKLVYSDGTLQEAGGIIWKDGSGWNYGRNDDAMKPEYNYVREVDYISGASIMIRRELWEQLGGFDELFVPAYCEDADLAFQVRKAGYKVVYQPLSVVVHFEGKSNGTDLNSGVKQYQIENSRKLRQKWRTELFRQYAQGQDVFKARERTGGKKVVLMVDHYVPQFDKDAGSKTIYQYLKMFVEKGYVVKFIGDNFFQHEPYTTILQQMGIEVLYGPWYAQHWQEWVLDNQKDIDFAFLNRPHIAVKYIDFLKEKTGIKCIYYGHDLHFLRLKREYELTGDMERLKESEEWKEKELYLMRNADISYYPSCVEVEEVRQLDPEIPAKAITAYAYKTFPEDIPEDFAKREGILFVGGFGHPPNIDAVLWFTKEIYPKIREKREIPFYIVGSKPTAEVLRLDGGGITVKGFVSEEELQELYRTCRLVTIPLRYGAGVKGKVVEALYYGTPMVTTSVGAEGIEGIEQVVNIADDTETFAAAVTELYDDVKELARRSELCRNFAKTKFSMDAVWAAIEEDFR